MGFFSELAKRLFEKRVKFISGGRILYRDGNRRTVLDYERMGGPDSYLHIPISINQRWEATSLLLTSDERAKAKKVIESVVQEKYRRRVEVEVFFEKHN